MSVINVSFYASLRDVVGGASLEVHLEPGSTAQDLIDLLVAQNPALGETLTEPGGSLHEYLKMFINGREVVYLQDRFEHVLQPTDKVDIFPPVGGG